ncbi:MAG: UMP kinase [Rhizobiales bacterium]|nr:UMP kinase [Hyphomicrobiales bacterium]
MTGQVRFRRALLKLSGEALLGEKAFGIDDAVADQLAGQVEAALALGVKVGIVLGGGNIFRGMTLAKAGGNRVAGDQMGMLATVMNAIAFEQKLAARGLKTRLFSAVAMPTFCETFNQKAAQTAYDAGEAVLFACGIGNPFVTTDTGAALRAAEMGADGLFKGTMVDGIYTADPKLDPTATRYDRLTYGEAIGRELKVMDTAAMALARENGIPIIVFSIHAPGGFVEILKGGGRATVVSG